jgi:hypothetical protein
VRGNVLVLIFAACGGGGERATPTTPTPSAAVSIAASPSTTASAVCSDAPAEAYQPRPAWSGRAAKVDDPPMLPTSPQRVGEAYTVYGAIRALHSIDNRDITAREVTLVGVIVDTNITRAPACALHPTGRADPPHCVTEIPTFTIADDTTPTAPRIRVMGWACNFANVYDAQVKDRAHDTSELLDELWAVPIPRPLPKVGMKVRVTGHYAVNFTRASSGLESDPRSGILTSSRTEYVR